MIAMWTGHRVVGKDPTEEVTFTLNHEGPGKATLSMSRRGKNTPAECS